MIALNIRGSHIYGEENSSDAALVQSRNVRVVLGSAPDISTVNSKTGNVIMRVDQKSGLSDLFDFGIQPFAGWRKGADVRC